MYYFILLKFYFILLSFYYRMKNHCNVWISKYIIIINIIIVFF